MSRLLAKIDGSPLPRAVLFCLALVLFGAPAVSTALREAPQRAGSESEWHATKVWLQSAECARRTGAWLALCENGKLLAINEKAFADDPGHALFLDLYATLSQREVRLVDVVYLNQAINILGFVALATLLFALRAYATLLIFLWLGPMEYVGWPGTSPHWAFIGATSLAVILPIALVARERGWLPRRTANVFLAIGLLSLGLAALIREVIGLMALMVTLGTLAVLWWQGRRNLRGLALIGVLVIAAWQTPRWTILARDMLFTMEPAGLVQSHGISHTLYISLISVGTGVPHNDAIGENAARRAQPGIVAYSPEYFRLMWRLYLQRILDDPADALRVYLLKARLLLGDSILEPAPPLWLSLVLAIGVLLAAGRQGWRRLGFEQGRAIAIVCLLFVGFFVVQGILALPNRLFSFPAGRLLIVVLGCGTEFAVRYSLARSSVFRILP